MSNRWGGTEITPYNPPPKSHRIIGAADVLSMFDEYPRSDDDDDDTVLHKDEHGNFVVIAPSRARASFLGGRLPPSTRRSKKKRKKKMARYGQQKKSRSKSPRSRVGKTKSRGAVARGRKLVRYNRLVAEGVSPAEARAEVFGGVKRVGRKAKRKSGVKGAPKRRRTRRSPASSRYGAGRGRLLGPEAKKRLFESALANVLRWRYGKTDVPPTADDLYEAEKLAAEAARLPRRRIDPSEKRIADAKERLTREAKTYAARVVHAQVEGKKALEKAKEQKAIEAKVEELAQKQLAAIGSSF